MHFTGHKARYLNDTSQFTSWWSLCKQWYHITCNDIISHAMITGRFCSYSYNAYITVSVLSSAESLKSHNCIACVVFVLPQRMIMHGVGHALSLQTDPWCLMPILYARHIEVSNALLVMHVLEVYLPTYNLCF